MFSILPAQLTTVTGIPGSGKSNFIEWYVLELVRSHNDLKASFYSPEHFPISRHASVLSEKIVGKGFSKDSILRMSRSELQSATKWAEERINFVAKGDGKLADWDWVIENFKQQCYRFGTNIFVIDAFNKVKRKNGDSLAETSEILANLTAFAQAHEAHVFLIAHPRKMPKDNNGKFPIPDLYDVKGNSEFYDQSHNGLAVAIEYNDNGTKSENVIVKNLKAKFKNQGAASVGEEVQFKFNSLNNRYYKNEKDNNPLWNNPKTKQKPLEFDKELQERRGALSKMSYGGEDNFINTETIDIPRAPVDEDFNKIDEDYPF
jgi:twinkle protein